MFPCRYIAPVIWYHMWNLIMCYNIRRPIHKRNVFSLEGGTLSSLTLIFSSHFSHTLIKSRQIITDYSDQSSSCNGCPNLSKVPTFLPPYHVPRARVGSVCPRPMFPDVAPVWHQSAGRTRKLSAIETRSGHAQTPPTWHQCSPRGLSMLRIIRQHNRSKDSDTGLIYDSIA